MQFFIAHGVGWCLYTLYLVFKIKTVWNKTTIAEVNSPYLTIKMKREEGEPIVSFKLHFVFVWCMVDDATPVAFVKINFSIGSNLLLFTYYLLLV